MPLTSMELKALKLNTYVQLLTICSIIGGAFFFTFQSGTFKADIEGQVKTLRLDVDSVKSSGSPGLQSHIASDKVESEAIKAEMKLLRTDLERRLDIDERKIEAINIFQVTIATLDGKLNTMDAKIDGVRKALDEHTRATQELMMKGPTR